MPEDKVKYVKPPNILRQKQRLAGVSGVLDAAWIHAAERQIEAARLDYEKAVVQDMANLHSICEEILKNPADFSSKIQALYGILQIVKGQGSSFGYPLVSAIGGQLARFVESLANDVSHIQVEIVKIHVEAIRFIVKRKLEGEGGQLGKELVASLGLLITKADRA